MDGRLCVSASVRLGVSHPRAVRARLAALRQPWAALAVLPPVTKSVCSRWLEEIQRSVRREPIAASRHHERLGSARCAWEKTSARSAGRRDRRRCDWHANRRLSRHLGGGALAPLASPGPPTPWLLHAPQLLGARRRLVHSPSADPHIASCVKQCRCLSTESSSTFNPLPIPSPASRLQRLQHFPRATRTPRPVASPSRALGLLDCNLDDSAPLARQHDARLARLRRVEGIV